MTDADFIVTLEHASTAPGWSTRAGLCHRGMRAWCARYEIDWLDFCRNGVPASLIIATGDAMALHVVEHAREQVSRGR